MLICYCLQQGSGGAYGNSGGGAKLRVVISVLWTLMVPYLNRHQACQTFGVEIIPTV